MKKIILKYLLDKNHILWEVCGNIALRFHDKEDGAYDDLQEKLYYWIRQGLINKLS